MFVWCETLSGSWYQNPGVPVLSVGASCLWLMGKVQLHLFPIFILVQKVIVYAVKMPFLPSLIVLLVLSYVSTHLL